MTICLVTVISRHIYTVYIYVYTCLCGHVCVCAYLPWKAIQSILGFGSTKRRARKRGETVCDLIPRFSLFAESASLTGSKPSFSRRGSRGSRRPVSPNAGSSERRRTSRSANLGANSQITWAVRKQQTLARSSSSLQCPPRRRPDRGAFFCSSSSFSSCSFLALPFSWSFFSCYSSFSFFYYSLFSIS